MNVDVEKQLVKIIRHELELPESYGKTSDGFVIPSVFIYAPNISLSNTDKLQISIQSMNSKVIANNNSSKEINGIFTEIQEALLNDMIQIDIFSRNNDAKDRRFEVLTSLHSLFAQDLQEKYHFRLFQIPNGFINTSSVEGGSRLYRYTLTIMAQYKRQYNKTANYYDKFKFNIETESSGSQFEIKANT